MKVGLGFKILIILVLTGCKQSTICKVDLNEVENSGANHDDFISKYGKPDFSDTLKLSDTKFYEFRYSLSELKDSVDYVIEDMWNCGGDKVYVWFYYKGSNYMIYNTLKWEKGMVF